VLEIASLYSTSQELVFDKALPGNVARSISHKPGRKAHNYLPN
jgi:hypothetical protein